MAYTVNNEILKPIFSEMGLWGLYRAAVDDRTEAYIAAGRKSPKGIAWADVTREWLEGKPEVAKRVAEKVGDTRLKVSNKIVVVHPDDVDQPRKADCESSAPSPGDGAMEQFPNPSRFMEPLDREPDPRAVRKWVWQHLGWPSALLKPEKCPNAAAWRLLLAARQDEKWFIEKVYAGIKPTKAELEDERKRDDSLPILDLITKAKRSLVEVPA